jgi:hypothetical protein
MNKIDIDIWSNLTFKTRCYRKNFDMINDNENIITEYDGGVSVLRLSQGKSPLVVGEYGYSVWNIELGKMLDVDFHELIRAHVIEDGYSELLFAINNKLIDITKYKKMVLIHSLVLRADSRKRGISEEFTEMIYRDHYDKDNLILALVKPFQNNPIDADYYFKRKSVQIMRNMGDLDKIDSIPAIEYYSLKELCEKNDTEYNEYKLFSVATKCGFSRVGESYLFSYSPEKTVERLIAKMKLNKELNAQ